MVKGQDDVIFYIFDVIFVTKYVQAASRVKPPRLASSSDTACCFFT